MERDEFASQAIRYSFLSNAGAIVALLAFLGQIWGVESPVYETGVELDLSRIETGIAWFITGTVTAVGAAFWRYVSWPGPRANTLILGIAVAASVGCFVFGALTSASILVEGASTWAADTWAPGTWAPDTWE